MKYQAIDSEYIREMKERDEFLKQKGYMLKGVKYGYFIAIIIIILSALFNGNLVLAQTSDIEYVFSEGVFFEETNPTPDFTRNIRNQTEYTGNHSATYSFDGEVNLTGTNIGFIDSDANTQMTVLESYQNHETVLQYNASVAWQSATHTLSDTSDEFEFWVNIAQTDKTMNIRPYDASASNGLILEFRQTGDFSYYDGIYHVIQYNYLIDTWYHIYVTYDCAEDHFHLWLNGKSMDGGTGYGFNGNPTTMDVFEIIAIDDCELYIDAIGFVSEGYVIGDNIIPYNYQNNTLEVNKWEFFNNEDGTLTIFDQEVIPFWDELLTSAKIATGRTEFDDETCVYMDITDTDHDGIEKSIDVNYGFVRQINFTWSWYAMTPGFQKGYIIFDIDSYDDTLIVRLRIDDVGVDNDYILSYYDGGSYIALEDVEGFRFNSHFNITIFNDIVVLNADNETYMFPVITSAKSGIGDIKIESYQDANDDSIFIFIDSVGVYIDGISQSNDFANAYFNLTDDFNGKEFNLFNINATGNFACSMKSFVGFGDEFVFFEYQNVSNRNFFNIYNCFTDIIEDAYLTITSNSSYNIDSLSITGVKLTDGTNNYYPTITDSNIDNNESYFYVSNSNLFWAMTSNDTDLEYMEAIFDIGNLIASNRSLKYSGVKSASSLEAQFKVNYVDSSYNPFTLQPDYVNLAVLLPRTKTIDTFGLLISDNDSNVNDTITGFIGSFTLIYVPLIATDFVSISFFDALPIVVLVVLIPIALYYGFGKKKELLVPSIIAMSIFGTAVGLIPLWLTFVIGFGCVSYFIMDRRN